MLYTIAGCMALFLCIRALWMAGLNKVSAKSMDMDAVTNLASAGERMAKSLEV
jgi:hypothetical protein